MEQQFPSQLTQRVNAKLTASSLIFRQLIDSLKRKNQQRKQVQHFQSNQPSQIPHIYLDQLKSQKPPQNTSTYDQSAMIENVFSQKNSYQITKHNVIKNIHHNASPNLNLLKKQMDNDQDVIRLKPRGSIDGRDVLKKKQIDRDSFQHKIPHFHETMRNKIIRVPRSIKKEIFTRQAQQNRANVTARQYYKNEQYQAKSQPTATNQNNATKTSRNFSQIGVNQGVNYSAKQQGNNYTFTQNRFNRSMAHAKKVKDIDQNVVTQFYKENGRLNQNSQAKDIFAFFNKLCQIVQVIICNPHIKKYKNCVYYGNQIMLNQRYEGFLYFFDSRFYFGDLFRGRKDGNGVQLNFKDDSIWRGYFDNGQKNGKFQVKRQGQSYIGYLKNGVQHGQGKLITKQSIYQGSFQNGYKHGHGQQIFPKSGLKLSGNFYQGIFQAQQVTTRIQAKHYFSRPQFHNPQKLQRIQEHLNKQQKDLPQPKFLPRYTSQGFHTTRKAQKHTNSGIEQAYEEQNRKNNKSTFPKSRFQETKKKLFNHQKLMRISPSPQDKLPGKNSKKDNNLMQFEYSFDASSASNTIASNSSFNPFGYENIGLQNTARKKGESSHLKGIKFRQRVQTSQIQQPLPVPCFYKS